jgi:hypothetical protein
MVRAGPVPVGADVDGEEDAAEDDVVEVVEVVAVDAEPPVEASATPVAPAPTPAATIPATMSRRPRPPIVEFIRFPPFRRPAAERGRRTFSIRLRRGPARHPKPASQSGMRGAAASWL